MDLKECFRKGMIKKTSFSEGTIISLMHMSNVREQEISKSKITKTNASIYVSMAYDCLREVLEAVCISKGYKVLSHICIGELLKTLIQNFDYDQFDRYRWIRNSINYYGKMVDFEQGRELVTKMLKMKKEIIETELKQFKDSKVHSDN